MSDITNNVLYNRVLLCAAGAAWRTGVEIWDALESAFGHTSLSKNGKDAILQRLTMVGHLQSTHLSREPRFRVPSDNPLWLYAMKDDEDRTKVENMIYSSMTTSSESPMVIITRAIKSFTPDLPNIIGYYQLSYYEQVYLLDLLVLKGRVIMEGHVLGLKARIRSFKKERSSVNGLNAVRTAVISGCRPQDTPILNLPTCPRARIQ